MGLLFTGFLLNFVLFAWVLNEAMPAPREQPSFSSSFSSFDEMTVPQDVVDHFRSWTFQSVCLVS